MDADGSPVAFGDAGMYEGNAGGRSDVGGAESLH